MASTVNIAFMLRVASSVDHSTGRGAAYVILRQEDPLSKVP